MSEPCVLDASALIARLQEEPGWDEVDAALPNAVISVVNLAEVLQKAAERGIHPEVARDDILSLGVQVVPLEEEDVLEIARLYTQTHRQGLSLADRACLALGRRTRFKVLHAEHRWQGLRVGVWRRHIRPRAGQPAEVEAPG